ncbi:PREDICTED: two-component response regulator ARR22 [Populus euphratica]|uniref:Two-component response regulator ARR22 n=1 Tax=Populus euphratica TaxID=75702 RepID=A0AAJ6X1L7_POPEU|nr:PREDICTED: two-component response regulator ARR22 [Populus euphratica]
MAGEEENNNCGENSFSVLVVDNDTVIRMVHRMLMTSLGLKVQEAKNGKEVVDLYINGASFDLILMDMEMPIMNGPAATRELRAMGVKSIIIGVTSHTSESIHKDFIEAGLNHCVAKPITIAKIDSFLPKSNNN